MAKKHVCPEPENTERWAVSYLDMITVMMCLFLVLYAISQVDQGKLQQLRSSLAAGFNNQALAEAPIVTTGGVGILTGSTSSAELGKFMGGSASQLTGDSPQQAAAKAEAKHLKEMQEAIENQLATAGHGKVLDYRITERGLVLGLVANDTYFDTGTATLQDAAREILNTVGPALSGLPEQIAVEGYADQVPINTARYPSNWDLAADRATQVLKTLNATGVPVERLRAVSYGNAHQTQPEEGQDILAVNRRVDIVVLSSAPEAVRALVPAVVSAAVDKPAMG
ncbi:MAG: flagellar motor protein MotB [Actinomycetaceae bacterium]|nr:flagellar motor protein MotB [Actinomycetaceae bacterium]